MSEEYTCAVTGLTGDAANHSDSDGLGDMPVGWMQITFRRRQYNPRWISLQQVKAAMVQAALQQVPEEHRAMQAIMLSVQVDAQFHSLEGDIPQYLSDVDETVYVSMAQDSLELLNQFREVLSLAPVLLDEGDEDTGADGE